MNPPKDNELSISVIRDRTGWWLFSLQMVTILEPVVFRAITVPAGYSCNLGSIPFGFRWIIRPFHWRSIKCYVVHDYLCDKAECWETRKLADLTLREHLKNHGYVWRPYAVYLAVRLNAIYWWLFKKN